MTPNPDIKKFITYAFETYNTRFQHRLVFTGRETKHIKDLLGQVDYAALCQYWDFYIGYSGQDWHLKTGTKDIKGFFVNINRIIQNCKITGLPESLRCHEQQTDPHIPTDFDLLLEQMRDYINTMLEGQGAELTQWSQKLETVKNIEQLTRFNAQFQQHLTGK